MFYVHKSVFLYLIEYISFFAENHSKRGSHY